MAEIQPTHHSLRGARLVRTSEDAEAKALRADGTWLNNYVGEWEGAGVITKSPLGLYPAGSAFARRLRRTLF